MSEYRMELHNLCKSYDGRTIIDDLSYTFESGKCYVIHGESGAGKTTLFNLITGYDEPDGGEIFVDGDHKIEYMMQEDGLFSSLTVMENLAIKHYANSKSEVWNPEEACSTEKALLEKFRMSQLAGKETATLSGGEKRRVALIGAMSTGADILLIDEPTANLDEKNREIISKMIETYVENRIVIIVSHIAVEVDPIVLELRGGRLYEK